MDVNVKKSLRLARRIQSKPDLCWVNAIAGLRRLFFARYVEGVGVVIKDGTAEFGPHGWIEQFGKIIETTPGWLGQTTLYFPARKYSRADVQNINELPILPLDAPEWTESYETAKLAVRMLNVSPAG